MYGRLIIITIIIMALDRECKDMPYLTGRLIAITEHYAKKHFGPNTIGQMFKFPKRYIEAFWHYVDQDDPDIEEIGHIPLDSMDNSQQNQAMVAYYHQRAVYNADKREQLQRIGQRIAEIRKDIEWVDDKCIKRKGMTQAELGVRSGLSQVHITRVERGAYSVRFDNLQAIAEALGGRVDIVL